MDHKWIEAGHVR